MAKIIILDYVACTVNILTITDKLLEKYDYDIEAILSNEYEFYHSEMAWMERLITKRILNSMTDY